MKKVLINFVLRFFAIIQVVIIFLLINVGWGVTFAQVKIEERVEISPQKNLPNYPSPQYTPCGPYPGLLDTHNFRQAVWNGSSFWLDPFQQLFSFQQSGGYALNPDHYYNIETTAGGEYFSITKLGGIDPLTGEYIEPEEIGNSMLNVKGEELIGLGQWQTTFCGTWEKDSTHYYQCHFSKDVPQGTEVIVMITDLTQGGPPDYFHTFIEIPTMITDEGYTVNMQHYYSHDINMWVYDPGNCYLGCGGYLPSWVTFTVEIVQGQEYGSIHNLLTDESTDIFTNIETEVSWPGESTINWFEFVADGVQPDTSSPAHVVIRYTPSDASVGIVEHNFYVEYNDIVPVEQGILVQFADPVVAPGDTTQIILRRQNSDGTIEDFSPFDGFEIGMIEGCEAGEILVDDSLDVYFEEAYQPIYFVADSNITGTDTVKIRVGLIEGIITSPIKTGEGEKETETNVNDDKRNTAGRKLINRTKEPEPLPMNPGTYCFLESLWTLNSLESFGFGIVGDGCESYSCSEHFPIESPPITLEKHLTIDYPNLQHCDPITNAFTAGYFRPLFDNILDNIKDEILVPFDVFACFDKDEDIWKFKINNGTGFKLRVLEDLCYSNLEGLVLIQNATTDLFNKIPDEKVCQALTNFEDQKRYYNSGVKDGDFIIESAIKNHEEVHEWTFAYLVNKTLDDEFLNEKYNEIMTFKESLKLAKECGQLFSNSQNSKSRAKTEFEYVMGEFIEKLKERYDRNKNNTFSLGGEKYSVSEILAQWDPHVQLEINLYQSNLEMFRAPSECNYKRGKVLEELIYEKILKTLGGN